MLHFEIKIIPNKPTGIYLLLPKWPKCKLAGSFHVRREHAACGLTPWLIWQTEWTLQASVLLTSRPTVPCCIGVDIYETCQRGLLELTNESRLKPTAARAAWHCHPEAAPVTAAVSCCLITMFTLVPLLWASDRCAENITDISAEKEKLINFSWLLRRKCHCPLICGHVGCGLEHWATVSTLLSGTALHFRSVCHTESQARQQSDYPHIIAQGLFFIYTTQPALIHLSHPLTCSCS